MLVDEKEIAKLASKYGEPIRWQHKLVVSTNMLVQRRRSLKDRRGEIVLVIPRPGKRVLLHTKEFYPTNGYRLPTGGIDIGEPIEKALRRELREETGFKIAPVRFLGVIEYEFRNKRDKAPFASYVFETEKTDARPRPEDTHERITDWREVDWSDLKQVAQKLEKLRGEWNEWGRFRAVPHRLAAEYKP